MRERSGSHLALLGDQNDHGADYRFADFRGARFQERKVRRVLEPFHLQPYMPHSTLLQGPRVALGLHLIPGQLLHLSIGERPSLRGSHRAKCQLLVRPCSSPPSLRQVDRPERRSRLLENVVSRSRLRERFRFGSGPERVALISQPKPFQ